MTTHAVDAVKVTKHGTGVVFGISFITCLLLLPARTAFTDF